MKKYNAKINGTMYEIEIELVKEYADDSVRIPSVPPQAGGSGAVPARPVLPPVRIPSPVIPASGTLAVPVPGTSDVPEKGSETERIAAPMPGTILSVNVTPGTPVKRGQVLLSLEAMKMENEIMAQKEGVVESVHVTEGTSVETGTLLCVIQS